MPPVATLCPARACSPQPPCDAVHRRAVPYVSFPSDAALRDASLCATVIRASFSHADAAHRNIILCTAMAHMFSPLAAVNYASYTIVRTAVWRTAVRRSAEMRPRRTTMRMRSVRCQGGKPEPFTPQQHVTATPVRGILRGERGKTTSRFSTLMCQEKVICMR